MTVRSRARQAFRVRLSETGESGHRRGCGNRRPHLNAASTMTSLILNLFTAALDHLGIPWTRSTKYVVSIYRKAATARLDTFVGPKHLAVPWTNVHYTA